MVKVACWKGTRSRQLWKLLALISPHPTAWQKIPMSTLALVALAPNKLAVPASKRHRIGETSDGNRENAGCKGGGSPAGRAEFDNEVTRCREQKEKTVDRIGEASDGFREGSRCREGSSTMKWRNAKSGRGVPESRGQPTASSRIVPHSRWQMSHQVRLQGTVKELFGSAWLEVSFQ